MGGFNNPVLGGGGALVRDSAHSPDYAAGVDGWSIDKDGSAEFNDVTVRGVFRLPSAYQARMTDLLTNPGFGSTGVFVEFGTGEWDRPVFETFSNSALIQVLMEGYNNNTAVSTLRLGHRVYSGPSATGPWTLEVDFNQSNGACVSNTGIGSVAAQQGAYATVHADIITGQTPTIKALTTDLPNRPWIQIRPGWRISSGSAASASFLQARLIVAPSE